MKRADLEENNVAALLAAMSELEIGQRQQGHADLAVVFLGLLGILFALLAWSIGEWIALLPLTGSVVSLLLCFFMRHMSLPPGKKTEETLVALLPRLQARDLDALSCEQRRWLYALLHTNAPVLVSRLLRALEQVGDSDAISYVQSLAVGRYLAANQSDIKDGAARCLEFLRIRQQEEQTAQQLLRPAHVITPSDALLRPAMPTTSDTPEQLLRPVSQEESEST